MLLQQWLIQRRQRSDTLTLDWSEASQERFGWVCENFEADSRSLPLLCELFLKLWIFNTTPSTVSDLSNGLGCIFLMYSCSSVCRAYERPNPIKSRAVRWWLDEHVSIRISRWTATGEDNVLLLHFSEANTVFSLSVTYRGAARCTPLKPEWHKVSCKENRVSWFRFDVKMNPVDNRIQMQNRHHHPPTHTHAHTLQKHFRGYS